MDQAVGKGNSAHSQALTRNDGKALYYELVLERTTRTSASLRRYAGSNGEPRGAVRFVLTNDAVVKLVTDIVGEK